MQQDRGVTFAKAMGVLAVWYLIFFAAAIIAVLNLPTEKPPPADCNDFACSFSVQDTAVLVIILYGLPALLVSAIVSVIIFAILMAARVRSSVVIGTAAGILPAIATLIIICGFTSALSAETRQQPPEPAPRVTQCIPISGGHSCPGG